MVSRFCRNNSQPPAYACAQELHRLTESWRNLGWLLGYNCMVKRVPSWLLLFDKRPQDPVEIPPYQPLNHAPSITLPCLSNAPVPPSWLCPYRLQRYAAADDQFMDRLDGVLKMRQMDATRTQYYYIGDNRATPRATPEARPGWLDEFDIGSPGPGFSFAEFPMPTRPVPRFTPAPTVDIGSPGPGFSFTEFPMPTRPVPR